MSMIILSRVVFSWRPRYERGTAHWLGLGVTRFRGTMSDIAEHYATIGANLALDRLRQIASEAEPEKPTLH